MKIKFFADDINDRRVWSWKDGEYITENTAEIENLVGLGFRFEEIVERKPGRPKKTDEKTEVKKPETKRGFFKRLING